jgi:two-component system, cell cycle sensor histidine kinase and response regulator CckA
MPSRPPDGGRVSNTNVPKSPPAPPVVPDPPYVAPPGETHRAPGSSAAPGKPARAIDDRTLRHNEEVFRELITNLSVGVLLMDHESRIVVSNYAARTLLGLDEDQLVGRTALDPAWNIIHDDGSHFPQTDFPVPTAIRERRSQLGVIMGVARPRHADRIWLLVDAVPTLNANGDVTDVVCSFSDITPLRQAEESLRASEEQLRRVHKMEAVGRLAGSVAHDFNNLLTAILGYTDLMISRMEDNDPRRREAEEIRRAAQRAGTLTRQLLAFSRPHMQELRVLQLARLVHEIEPMLRRVTGEAVEFRVAADAATPSVRGDPGLIEQVLLNLAINARDAMPHGGRLRIATEEASLDSVGAAPWGLAAGRYALLTVEDTGPGMDDVTRARIFEPFFTTKPQGTGLGLASVYRTVRESGGAIRVESVPGEGTKFSILFPAAS